MTQRLTIPGRLPGYNDLTTGHWATDYRSKSEAMDIIGWEIKRKGISPVAGKAVITIRCYERNRRRDPSNVRAGAEKVILDALQSMGIIQNDNWRWLTDVPATVEVDRGNPRVEIEIQEGSD